MLQQLQKDILNGLSPLVAALLAALDLARQKVMDPDGYSQESLRRDLGLDLLERLWERSSLSEEKATTLAVEAQHETRRRRR